MAGQAIRGFGYGYTAIVLGDQLAARGLRPVLAGLLLAAVIAGSALTSLAVGVFSDRLGRRRSYGAFFLALSIAGFVVALNPPLWILFMVALTGTLSTDVVDNGAATTLEQVMLAEEDAGTGRVYGWYNAAGATFGALGALGAALTGVTSATTVHSWYFAVLVPVGLAGALVAKGLSPAVEAPAPSISREPRRRRPPGPSQPVIRRMSALFAVDAAGGGLVTTGFLSYYFVTRYGVSLSSLGWLFFVTSATHAASVLVAPRLARRFGLLQTMVGTHLPSNVLLALVAVAPSFRVAAILLLARTTVSQMDVPTRQALVMTLTTPAERTSAAAATNAARYSVRPLAPLVGGALQSISPGVPLVVAGIVKCGYDLALWRWARGLANLRDRASSKTDAPTSRTEEAS